MGVNQGVKRTIRAVSQRLCYEFLRRKYHKDIINLYELLSCIELAVEDEGFRRELAEQISMSKP
jgi:hypothetical protein